MFAENVVPILENAPLTLLPGLGATPVGPYGTFAGVARAYVDLGWPVFPICNPGDQGQCACGRRHGEKDAGKAPLTATGHKAATTDQAQLDAWRVQFPFANTGVDLEAAGLLVLDLDSQEAIREATQRGLPDTATVRTGKGEHRYFRRPEGCPTSRAIHRGESRAIDVLASGYAVVPGSQHRSGTHYEWAKAPSDFPDGLPFAPEWVVDYLRERPASGGIPVHAATLATRPATAPPILLAPEAQALWDGQDVVYRPDGTGIDRSQTVFRLAMKLAERKDLDALKLASLLRVWDMQQQEPKYALRKDADKRYLETAQKAIQQVGAVISFGDEAKFTEPQWRDRYLGLYGDTAYGRGQWWRYFGGVWQPHAEQKVKNEMAELMGYYATNRRIGDVLGLVKAHVYRDDTVWDGNPDALVCKNGTLDLLTYALRPHDLTDFATVALPFDFDRNAQAPVWRQYLAETMGQVGEGVAAFIQEFAGYCLTDDMRHEIALWLYSPPGTGKSTFLAGLEAMLGGKGSPLHGHLSLRSLTSNRFSLAGLPGKRLMLASEQPGGYLDQSDTLNAIISGDAITVEQKHKDAYTIHPTCKLVWAMNELPRVSEAHNGIYRRIKVIKLPSLDENRRDPMVKEHIMNEGPGILVWALEGLQRLRDRGHFVTPAAISAATEEYRQTNDVVAQFVAERCLVGPEHAIRPQALYGAYRQWCENNGYKAKARNTLTKDWERLGFTSVRRGGYDYWKGVSFDQSSDKAAPTLTEPLATSTAEGEV